MTAISLDRRVPALGGFTLTYLGIELKRKLRNRRGMFFSLIFPVAMFLLLGYPNLDEPLTATPVADGGVSYAAYFMVGMGLYGAMIAATSAGSAVAVERAQGWSRQLRLTPLHPVAAILTKVVAGLAVGLVAVVATYAAGLAVGVRLAPEQWLLSGLAAWLLGATVFTALGLLVGYLVPGENTAQVTNIAVVFLSFLGGLFYPLEMLPTFAQDLAVYTPVYGIAQIGRAPLTGAGFDVLWLVNAVAWLAVFTVGAVLAFRRDTERV